MWACIKAAFSRHLSDLGWWLLSVLIACIITAIVGGAATGGAALPVVLVGCLVVSGISIAASLLYALARTIWDCI